jgi:hypothetical protein
MLLGNKNFIVFRDVSLLARGKVPKFPKLEAYSENGITGFL